MNQWNRFSSVTPADDEDGAHHQRAQDAPEQHLVLKVSRYAEVAKDQQKDEQIINAERLLDQVAGDELQRKLGSSTARAANHRVPEKVDEHREARGQRDPDQRPADRFAEA